MAISIEFILDDIDTPPPEIAGIIGTTRFSHIRRQRKLLVDVLRQEAAAGGCTEFHYLCSKRELEMMVTRIENGPAETVCYIRLPGCLAPFHMARLRETVDKARYAMETTLIGPVFGDEAAAVLVRQDALAVLGSSVGLERRTVFLRLANEFQTMLDHLGLVDLRRADELLRFFTGSTEARHFNALKVEAGVVTKSSVD